SSDGFVARFLRSKRRAYEGLKLENTIGGLLVQSRCAISNSPGFFIANSITRAFILAHC
ncbi:MAG: hypothetical protein ACI9KN_001594, partial [Gammaproteobacteria bacterium]